MADSLVLAVLSWQHYSQRSASFGERAAGLWLQDDPWVQQSCCHPQPQPGAAVSSCGVAVQVERGLQEASCEQCLWPGTDAAEGLSSWAFHPCSQGFLGRYRAAALVQRSE